MDERPEPTDDSQYQGQSDPESGYTSEEMSREMDRAEEAHEEEQREEEVREEREQQEREERNRD